MAYAALAAIGAIVVIALLLIGVFTIGEFIGETLNSKSNQKEK